VIEIAEGVHRWTARHPEWHPGEFGAEVACFAIREPKRTLLIDPLVLGDWSQLDAVVQKPAVVLITVPYHVRSSAEAVARYRAELWGADACRRRLPSGVRLRELSPADAPHGVRAFAVGNPVRHEMPLLVESRRALCFGDTVVGVEGDEGPLRVWGTTPNPSETWYRDRFLPTVQPLADLDVELVLVGHGPPVTAGAGDALRQAFARPQWYRPGLDG
jgi:glyoxylase-like metal-dependent hydrolase (beta-lactamase superfamily II)